MMPKANLLWRETLGHQAPGMLVNLAATLGIAWLLLPAAGAPVWVWLLSSLLTTAVRTGLYLSSRRQLDRFPQHPPRAWLRYAIVAGLLLAAAHWAALGWWGIPHLEGANRFAVIVVLAALAGGATGTLAPLNVTGKAYILTLLLPACLQLLRSGEPAHVVLALLGIVFAWVMVASHHHNHQLVQGTIDLAQDKEALIEQLSARTDELRCANEVLEQRVAERTAALNHLAQHDPLTGLMNRRGLMAAQAGLLTERPAQVLLCFIDLDRFKEVNDTLGHDVGDLLLGQVAQRLTQLTAQAAQALQAPQHGVCRWGGDEFVAYVSCAASGVQAQPVAEQLHAALCAPYNVRDRALQLGASLGFVLMDAGGPAPLQQALACADLAAAESKRRGRGRCIEYAQHLRERQQRRQRLSAALRHATQDGSLGLVFQPIVEAASGHPVSYEALLRWYCPGVGAVPPTEFIALAEESDTIHRLGLWVLQQACGELARLRAAAPSTAPRTVAVNTSLRQLATDDFPTQVRTVLAEAGLPASSLVIEVTESVFDDQAAPQVAATLRALHALGVELHVDDFGTGYSALSRLREFPIHAIKVDKSFVIAWDDRSAAVVEGTTLIAHRMGLRVIAEGVETAERAAELARLGVDEFQGYHYGRPGPLPGPERPGTLPSEPSHQG